MKYGTVRGLANGHLDPEFGELWPTFAGRKFLTADISDVFCRSATKFGNVRGIVGTKF